MTRYDSHLVGIVNSQVGVDEDKEISDDLG